MQEEQSRKNETLTAFNPVERFAELRRSEAFVKRWLKHYSDRDLISSDVEAAIARDLKNESTLSPEHATKTLEDTEGEFATQLKEGKDPTPDQKAYTFARRAKLRFTAGQDYRQDLVEAQTNLGLINYSSRTRPSIECIRAFALVHGLLKSYVTDLNKPTVAELANYSKEADGVIDQMLERKENGLEDVALVLNEKDREEFLSNFPEERRKHLSVVLDAHVSRVLHSNVPTTEDEMYQVAEVEKRAASTLREMIQSGEFASMPHVLKLVCATLGELDSVESVHVLNEAGKLGLQTENVYTRGRSSSDVLKRWSAFARILKTESDIPSVAANAGMLGMKYLALSHLPDKLFNFFIHKMVQTGFLTNKVFAFPLSDKHNKELLHELITKYPSQFNTIVDTLAAIEGFDARRHTREVLDALAHLETLVPATFEAYITGTFRDRVGLLEGVKASRARLYENLPIEKNGSPPQVPLAEHVYMATEPVNMSFARFNRMYERLTDRTFDLHKYRFPFDGYAFELSGASGTHMPKLKSGQEVGLETLQYYRDVLMRDAPAPQSDEAKVLIRALEAIAKGGTLQGRDSNLPALLSLLSTELSRNELLSEFPTVTGDNAYAFILGVEAVYEDTEIQEAFARNLDAFMQANPELAQRVIDLCKKPDRFKTLTKRIESVSKQGFRLGFDVPEQVNDTRDAAQLLTAAIYASSFLPMRREISKEKKKFETPKDRREVKNIDNLKAYISKNVAAFFARAAVGICTFEDVSSWNRENYFHINVVEDDEHLRANVQAFVIRLEGKPVLLLRGINPNSPFLKRIDAGAFCEEILKIARQFQEDNGLEGVYISEQAEWHALSNRQPIYEYLIGKYVKPENEVVLPKPMVMSKTVGVQSIGKIYKVS